MYGRQNRTGGGKFTLYQVFFLFFKFLNFFGIFLEFFLSRTTKFQVAQNVRCTGRNSY